MQITFSLDEDYLTTVKVEIYLNRQWLLYDIYRWQVFDALRLL